MGYEIARSAVSRGADVTLVSGPVSIEAVDKAENDLCTQRSSDV